MGWYWISIFNLENRRTVSPFLLAEAFHTSGKECASRRGGVHRLYYSVDQTRHRTYKVPFGRQESQDLPKAVKPLFLEVETITTVVCRHRTLFHISWPIITINEWLKKNVKSKNSNYYHRIWLYSEADLWEGCQWLM